MNIAALRLRNQQIARPRFDKPEQVVAWLGGMQGQDYPGAKWSIGLRLANAGDADIERAIDERKILRTWPMRGTLHFVAAQDVRWMLALTSPKNLAGSALRRQRLELDDQTLARCREIFVKALGGGKQMTRDELYALLERANIATASQRGYHILWNSALHGLICFAGSRDKEQTFALLDEWLPPVKEKTRSEALAELALRYFTSRSPVTLADFIWWSGLSAGDARAGFDAIKSNLVQETVNKQIYWMPADSDRPKEPKETSVHLLPGFDEYLLGYKDRSAVLDAAHAGNICPGGNGMFLPTLVIDGRVVGTWKRTARKKGIEVSLMPFAPIDASNIAAAAQRYSDFIGLPLSSVKVKEALIYS